jgi:hypothetical protein
MGHLKCDFVIVEHAVGKCIAFAKDLCENRVINSKINQIGEIDK